MLWVGDKVIINEAGSMFHGYVGTIYSTETKTASIVFNDDGLKKFGPLPFINESIDLVEKDNMRRTRLNSKFIKEKEEFNNSFTSYSNYRKTKDEIESGEWFTKNFQWDWRRIGLASVLVLATIYSGYIGGLLCMVGAIAASVLTIYLVRPKGVLEYIAANPHKEFKPLEQEDK